MASRRLDPTSEAAQQAALESQLSEMAMLDADGLEILMRLGQAVFPDAAHLTNPRMTVWPERDRSTPSPRTAAVTDSGDLRAMVERSETRFQALVSQLPAVVFLAALGEGENEVYVSPQIEELLGFSAEEWLGDPLLWYHQLQPDDHEVLIAAFTRGVQSGGAFRAEVRFFARDGSTVWILGEARLIKDTLGRPDFFQGVAFDITANKQAEELVREADRKRHEELSVINIELTRMNAELTAAKEAAELATRTREVFLATMSHELRTPLNAVIALSQLLGESELGVAQAEMVATMQAAAGFLLTLISDILDFSRLRASGVELDVRPFSPYEWMEDTFGIVQPRVAEKSLTLTYTIEDCVPEAIVGDEVRLRQVLLNLLTNATKFTPAGEIAVHLGAERLPTGEWQMTCSVDDSGVGVAPETASVLFDEFRQADSGVSREHGGAGLGLSICKRLCELMGGRIWIAESRLGGARFVFSWVSAPAEADFAPPLGRRPAPSSPRASLLAQPDLNLRILVAEDNEVNAFVAKRLLENLGLHAEFVRDGLEAIAAVEAGDFDVVLMDVSMPKMDGLAASRAIRARGSALRQPLIVALTANAMAGDRAECVEAGMNDYITKPIDRAELARALSETTAGHPSQSPALHTVK